jgi:hypothetical protein
LNHAFLKSKFDGERGFEQKFDRSSNSRKNQSREENSLRTRLSILALFSKETMRTDVGPMFLSQKPADVLRAIIWAPIPTVEKSRRDVRATLDSIRVIAPFWMDPKRSAIGF